MNKTIIALFAILALTSASNFFCLESEKLGMNECSSQGASVCAIKQSNLQGSNPLRLTYKSRCDACKDSSVQYLAEGECELYPKNGTFCHPDSINNKFCTEEYKPVCGMLLSIYARFRGGPMIQTFSNGCNACISGSFFHMPGACGEQQQE